MPPGNPGDLGMRPAVAAAARRRDTGLAEDRRGAAPGETLCAALHLAHSGSFPGSDESPESLRSTTYAYFTQSCHLFHRKVAICFRQSCHPTERSDAVYSDLTIR